MFANRFHQVLITVSIIRDHLAQNLAKWQLPDDILWVEDLPLTATGKVSKLTLRERFKDHVL